MKTERKNTRAEKVKRRSLFSRTEVTTEQITRGDRGYILMLALIIMMTLTVIAVGYVMNVTLETSIEGNTRESRSALNVAEAGLEVAMMITHEEISDQSEPFTGTDRTRYDDGSTTSYGYEFLTLFEDRDGFEVKYRVIPENPDVQKNRFIYRTYDFCQELIHYAYPYVIEVVAESLSETGGTEYLKRQIRVLETPLVQYFAFYDDDMGIHPGEDMILWGRMHSNGNIWFAPDSSNVRIKNFVESTGDRTKHFVTASGVIYYDTVLGPPFGVHQGGTVYLRVHNTELLGTANEDEDLYPGDPDGDYVHINADITPANADTEIPRFTDDNDCTYLNVGVPRSPAIESNSLFRGGFYEEKARTPDRQEYFGICIVLEGSVSSGSWPPSTSGHNEIRELHIYAATKDFAYDSHLYPNGVKLEDVTDLVYDAGSKFLTSDGEIVYCPETVVDVSYSFPASDTEDENPVYLNRNDQRQEMAGVALTVVNLEALEKWFFEDYLDSQYDNLDNNQNINSFLYDPDTGNTRKMIVYCSRTPTVDEVSGVSGWNGVYTAEGGPPYPYYDDPGNQCLQAIKIWKTEELVCPTTFVTDNPIYIQGNGNDGTEGFNTTNTTGCAVVADLVNLLSNFYSKYAIEDHEHDGKPPAANDLTCKNFAGDGSTKYCGAFFTGREDLDNFTIRGGPHNYNTAGLHNTLALHENLAGDSLTISGCIICLWDTRQALGWFWGLNEPSGDVYSKRYDIPDRYFGWDPGFEDPEYWPPYCPSAYGVERVGWLEGDTYEEEYIWSPE